MELPLLLLGILSWVVSFKNKGTKFLNITLILFVLSFLTFKIRPYWYAPILPIFYSLIAFGFFEIIKLVKKNSIHNTFLIIGFLCLIPSYLRYSNRFLGKEQPTIEQRTDYRAKRWIEKNIPPNSKILLIGWYALGLPRIVADKLSVQKNWGETFMYERDKMENLHKVYELAYSTYKEMKLPTYDLVSIRVNYYSSPDPAINSFLNDSILNEANNLGTKYIVTSGPHPFQGTWESNPSVKLLATFDQTNETRGHVLKIFYIDQ